MINVVILGRNGALGSSVAELLGRNSKIRLSFVVRDQADCAEDKIFWDYRSSVPEQLKRADVVVICARSEDFSFNVSFNHILIRSLPSSVKLISTSSNAVFAKPNGSLLRWIFKGDAYIREKLSIEKYSSQRDNMVTLRPTIVIDEGAWRSFFLSCKSADRVIAPSRGDRSRIKITTRAHIAQTVENCIFSNEDLPPELFESIAPVDDVIGCQVVFGDNNSNFFDSTIKNILVIILSSWLIPDRVVFILQKAMLSRAELPASNANPNQLVIEGMTRLYLFGDHTK